MKAWISSILVTLLLAVSAVLLAQAPQQQAGATLTIIPIKPDLYLIMGRGANATLRITNDGLIVGDTKNGGGQNYSDLMAQIRTVSDKPVKWVVVTNHRADHSGNVGPFQDAGAKVVAHSNVNKNIDGLTSANKPSKVNTTFSGEEYEISLGQVLAKVYHFGRATTDGDSFLYYPDLKVLHAGDTIVGGVPTVDYAANGNAVEWQKVLDKVSKLDIDIVVPGHPKNGATVMTRAEFLLYKTQWDRLITRAKDLVNRGTPKEQLFGLIPAEELGWPLSHPGWNQPSLVNRFYLDLQADK